MTVKRSINAVAWFEQHKRGGGGERKERAHKAREESVYNTHRVTAINRVPNDAIEVSPRAGPSSSLLSLTPPLPSSPLVVFALCVRHTRAHSDAEAYEQKRIDKSNPRGE